MKTVSVGDMTILDSSIIGPTFFLLNCHFSFVTNKACLAFLLTFASVDVFRYFLFSAWDLTYALQIHIFSIKYPPKDGLPPLRRSFGLNMNGVESEKSLAHKAQTELLFQKYYVDFQKED